MADCVACKGERWICEQHPAREWPHDDCAGPGMPCACNPRGEPHPGAAVIWTARDGYAH